jgi:hypothetical protein
MGGLLRHLQREPIGSLPWVTSDRVEPAAGPAMSASHPKATVGHENAIYRNGPQGDIAQPKI